MIKRKKMISLLLVLTLVSGMFVQTYATEIDDTKKKGGNYPKKDKGWPGMCCRSPFELYESRLLTPHNGFVQSIS